MQKAILEGTRNQQKGQINKRKCLFASHSRSHFWTPRNPTNYRPRSCNSKKAFSFDWKPKKHDEAVRLLRIRLLHLQHQNHPINTEKREKKKEYGFKRNLKITSLENKHTLRRRRQYQYEEKKGMIFYRIEKERCWDSTLEDWRGFWCANREQSIRPHIPYKINQLILSLSIKF